MESELNKNQILRNVQELLEKQTKKGRYRDWVSCKAVSFGVYSVTVRRSSSNFKK